MASSLIAMERLTRNRQISMSSRLSLSISCGFASSESDENDVVVISGGPGGHVAALKVAQHGLKTTCIEKRDALGGTFLNAGIIPSKVLLHSEKHAFSNHGLSVSPVEIDLPATLAKKDTAVKNLSYGVECLFKKNKVHYVKGYGKFLSPTEVSVELIEGGNTVVKGKHIIVATGSDVKSLLDIAIDEKKVVSSTAALSLTEVPNKLVVIGAGFVGLELGSVWGLLGSEVTVAESASEMVP